MEHRVALFGSSVALDCLGAALGTNRECDLVRRQGELAECGAWIDELAPQVVIFDLSAMSACHMIDAVQCLNVLLLGINFATQQMWIMSGAQARLATTEDLLQVLERYWAA